MATAADLSATVPVGHFDVPIWGFFIVTGVFLCIGIASLVLRKVDPDEHVSILGSFPSTATLAFFIAVVTAAPPLIVLAFPQS
ncbi:hypothetical protein [Curtobacterium sp. AB7]|uniref:hypothetical protein n=1 Tax=Curtobacterium sp. AB7 TaxID=3349327 RepID=UPI003838E5DB